MAEPAEKGRANEAVAAILVEVLAVTPERVRLATGHASTRKVWEVEGLDANEARRRINEALAR